jgi:hypothetical protein
MVFSVSPSVTVREIDATASIPAIATPPAAIAGVFRWGPTNEKILITSENELVSRFGKPTDDNAETFFVAADYLSYSNALYVTRVVSADANTASGTYFDAKYPGELGNALRVGYVTSANSYSEVLTDPLLLENTGMTDVITINTNEFLLITTDDFRTVLGENDIIRVGNDDIGYQNLLVNTANTVVTTTIEDGGTANTADDITITTYTYRITFKNRYSLSATSYKELNYERVWGYSYLFSGPPVAGSMHIVVEDTSGIISGAAGTVLEVYENVSRTPNTTLSDGTNNYYRTVIENRSAWIVADAVDTLDDASNEDGYESLTGGGDGDSESEISLGKLALGYDLYRDAQEIDIAFVLQGKAISANLANYIISNIADRRKDCVAFISPPYAEVVAPSNPQEKLTRVIAFRNQVQNSSYFFMDSGYKYRYDKYNDKYRWVPLNGDMAGLCSRIDPWESPAGYKRGIIKNVVKLAFNPNKEQRDQLYGSDVNPVISQVGQGVLLFGDKTGLGTATGSAFTRINVRRLFITLEKAIATVSASFLFDFNDEFTQTQFRNLVEPFLRDIQGRRGIIDFRVVSDASVNTPDVIDRNIFRGNIFVKPSRTINFIELTFIATRTGVEFDEIVGQAL